jgi:hypothetical protein
MTAYECSCRAGAKRRRNLSRRSLRRRIAGGFVQRLGRVVLLTACLCVVSVLAQSGNTIPPTSTMKTFVIIFRQGPQQLTESDKQRRAQETVAWARGQNAAGHKLDPRILAPEGERRGSGNSSSDGWPVTALLFLEAHDLSEATQIAEAHPAIRYGSEIEVRPWAPPVPSGTATASPAAR